MRTKISIVLFGFLSLFLMRTLPLCCGAEPASGQSTVVRSGWYGIFPAIDGFDQRFARPIVNKRGYEQTTIYASKSNPSDILHVTAGRKFGAESPAGSCGLPSGNRVWKQEIDLGKGKYLSFDAYSGSKHADSWARLQDSFQQSKFISALDHPPRTSFVLTESAIKGIPEQTTYSEVLSWLGPPSGDIGSGIHIFTYPLEGGGRVLLGTPDMHKVFYVRTQTAEEAAKFRGL